MADNDLTNQLEDILSDITSESETEQLEDVPLLREIVADLLEGEVVTEPGTGEPAIAEVRAYAFTQRQPVAEEQGNAFILEEAVAGLFENDSDTTYDVVEPVVAKVPTGVTARLDEEKGEDEVPLVRVSSLGVAPIETRIKSLKVVSYILFFLLGLLLVFLLTGLIWPTLVAGPVSGVLYLTGCVLALAMAVILWKRNLSLADDVREAEEERVEALDSQLQLAERVTELNTVNSVLQKRALQFESANQVLNALSPTLEPDQLVQEAVNQVRDRFDLYYVGLFLIDESGQSAALRACTLAGWQGQAGAVDHEMLSQGYKLEVGGASMVGRCTGKGQALIVLDLDEEAYHHDYTLLPGACSEMTLPLQSGGRVLGALDLQSIQRQAFSREDSDMLQLLADQLATAIENAQTLVELEARLETLSPGEFQPGDTRVQRPGFTLGPAGSFYERTQSGVASLRDKSPPEVEQAVTQRDLIVQEGTGDGEGRSALVAPIALRGEVIGALGFHEEDSRQWTNEEIALIEDVATQVSLAVENVRLFDQTQRALNETDALYRASRGIASADSVEGILHAIVGSLTSPQIDQCFLGIFDSPGGKLSDDLVVVSSWSQEAEPLWQLGTQLSLNQDLLGERVERDQPLILSDVAAESGLNEIKSDELMSAGIRSLAVVPLVAVGGWIGVLTLAAARAGAITERNVQPYLALAGQAALSIERSSLFKQTQEALEETSMLYRASRAIGAATSIPEVASVLLSSVDEGGFERGLVLIRRQVDDQLEVVAGWDQSGRPVEVGAQMDINQVSPNMTIYSAMTRKDAPSNHRLLDEVWERWVSEREGAGLASIPILFRGSPLGILLVESCDAEQLSEKTLQPFVTLAAQAAVAIENRHLFDETRRAAEQEALLNEMLRNLATALNVSAIIDIVQDPLARLVPFDHLSMALLDKDTETLEVFHPGGEQAEDAHLTPKGQIVSLQETLTRQAIRTGKTMVFDLSDPNLVGVELEPLRQAGTRTCIIIPMVYGRNVLGSLNLAHSSPRAYTTADVPLLERMAQLTAVALENARLFEQTQAALGETEALYRASRRITTSPDLPILYQILVDEMASRLAADQCQLTIFDHDIGYSETVVEYRPAPGTEKTPGPLTTCPAYVALRDTREPLAVEDVRSHPAFAHRKDVLARTDTRSMLLVPIVVRDELIGGLEIHSIGRRRVFTEGELEFCQTLAGQTAIAIENRRAFVEIQRRADEMGMLFDVSQSLVGAPLESEEIATIICRQFLEATRVPECSISLLDSERNVLRVLVDLYVEEGKESVREDIIGQTTELSSYPATARVIRTLRPLVVQDSNPNADPAELAYMWDNDVTTLAIIPLAVKGQAIGIIELETSDQERYYTAEELNLAMTLANQAAVALENARLYEEQRHTTERLREMDKLKTQFLANMSHELRTPLNSIIGFSRVILKGIDGPLTEMQQTDLTAIYHSGQHLLGLINDILDLSKIEAGKMDLNFDEVDLKPIIRGVMSSAVGLVKDKQVELEQRVPDELPNIWADATRIRQVLLNLVSNATKFTEKGKITLAAGYDETCVTIRVSDSGVGIPAEKLESIFEEFTQVDGTTTRSVGGTGLGLPISRYFVGMHGGEITVESEVGVGSTFTVTLPTYAQTRPEMGLVEYELDERSPAAERLTVLAVDDDPGVISLYRRFLDSEGYRVVGVTNSEEVLEKASELQPFAITLDVLMPTKDGWQVLRELKANPRTQHIPIIVCSIVSNAGLGFSLGAADYLVKPIMEEELLAALARRSVDRQERGDVEVLVIDDQADDILLIRRMLEAQRPLGAERPLEAERHYRVIEADGGRAGIDLVHRRKPDIVILDLMMPEVDGFAVLEDLKREPHTRDIPVIVITAKDLTEEEQQQLEGQVEVLLRKGLFTEQELLDDLATALSQIEQ